MSLPVTADLRRIRSETSPAIAVVVAADLTGHTVHLVVATAAGVEVDRAAGTIAPGASSSTITISPTSAMVASAYAVGAATYAVILDVAETFRRTIATGDWVVEDPPG